MSWAPAAFGLQCCICNGAFALVHLQCFICIHLHLFICTCSFACHFCLGFSLQFCSWTELPAQLHTAASFSQLWALYSHITTLGPQIPELGSGGLWVSLLHLQWCICIGSLALLHLHSFAFVYLHWLILHVIFV